MNPVPQSEMTTSVPSESIFESMVLPKHIRFPTRNNEVVRFNAGGGWLPSLDIGTERQHRETACPELIEA